MTEAVTQPGILPDDLVPPPTRQPQKQSTRPPVENIPLVRSVASAPSAPPSIPNMPTIPPAVPAPVSMPAQPRGFADPQQGQQWWSRSEAEMSNGAVPQMSRPQVQPGMLYSSPTSNRIRRASPRRTNRRAVVAAIVGGGVVAASAGIAIKFNLLHLLANGNTATAHNGPGGQSAQRPPNGQTQGAGGTQSPKTTPTAATQKPTQQPTKAPPAHTGTVVGSTTLASNTSRVFTNPQDGKGSLLIHLPKGSFAAYESACTHEGVTVNYDPNTMTLVCPAHGAIFDPTSGQVLQGPATRALTAVAIKVNTDGTITVG